MKTIDEIESELRKQKHQLAKDQHMIDISKTDIDKHKSEIKFWVTSHIIKTLEWVLSDS